MPNLAEYALPIGIGVAVLIFVIVIILSGYVKAPPDVAFIISGPRKKKKILIGRAGVRIPFIERKDILLLKQISIDIKTNGFVPTNDFIGVDIDAVAKVRVKTDPEGIELAMKNFLNMNEERICAALTDSLQGNMREIIGTVGLRELNTDRKKDAEQGTDRHERSRYRDHLMQHPEDRRRERTYHRFGSGQHVPDPEGRFHRKGTG